MSKLSDALNKRLKNTDYTITSLEGDDTPISVADRLSTGSMALDWVMGGGLPQGRIVELYGEESSGKSLIAYQCAAQAQSAGMDVLYIDAEHAVSHKIVTALGVDLETITYAEPSVMEDVFRLIENALDIVANIKDHPGLLIVWDSVAATSVAMEQDADYGKSTMGRHANVMSQSLRKLTGKIARTKAYVLFINQTRENIGVMFGDKVSTFGGKALKFHASVRVQLYKPAKIRTVVRGQKRVIGAKTRALCVKNKVAAPYREAILPIYFGSGIKDSEAIFETLKALGAIKMTPGNAANKLIIFEEEYLFQTHKWNEVFEKHYEDIEYYLFQEDDEIDEDNVVYDEEDGDD